MARRLLEIGLVILAAILAICLGNWIAEEDWFTVAIVLAIPVGIFLLVGDYSAMLWALAIVLPFTIPVTVLRSLTPASYCVGIALLSLILRHILSFRRSEAPISGITPLIFCFFAWVAFRYALKPVFPDPEIATDSGVTGFRSYCNYALAFVMVWSMGKFIRTPEDFKKMIRWLLGLSLAFTILFGVLIFVREPNTLYYLRVYGIFIDSLPGGYNRFVILPGFGAILMLLALLPGLLQLNRPLRVILFILGILALIAGANRSSVIVMGIAIIMIPLLKRRFALLGFLLAAFVGCGFLASYAGEGMSQASSANFGRVVGLVSPRVAELSGGEGTMEWRYARWRRAWIDIHEHPWVGMGYGGMKKFSGTAFTSPELFEEEMIERDLATGGIHNGFIATSWALGIPAVVLFITLVLTEVFLSARKAWQVGTTNPAERDANIFACSYLLAMQAAVYIGMDLSNPLIWFFVSLSVVARRINWSPLPPTNPHIDFPTIPA